MLTGARSWNGINILILGKKALLPMQLEQRIADAVPSDEVRLQSFENYNDAFDYCKTEKNVGFFVIFDDSSNPRPSDIFLNLSKPYQASGWPPFGVLIHENEKSVYGLEEVFRERRFLDYISFKRFSTVSDAQDCMGELLDRFIRGTETTLFPPRFRESITNVAVSSSSPGEIWFYDSLFNLLKENIDLTWREHISLQWAPIILNAKKHDLALMAPHGDLESIVSHLPTEPISMVGELSTFCSNKKEPLETRFYQLLKFICNSRAAGTLVSDLRELSLLGVPGSSSLLRAVKRHSDKIIAFTNDRREVA